MISSITNTSTIDSIPTEILAPMIRGTFKQGYIQLLLVCKYWTRLIGNKNKQRTSDRRVAPRIDDDTSESLLDYYYYMTPNITSESAVRYMVAVNSVRYFSRCSLAAVDILTSAFHYESPTLAMRLFRGLNVETMRGWLYADGGEDLIAKILMCTDQDDIEIVAASLKIDWVCWFAAAKYDNLDMARRLINRNIKINMDVYVELGGYITSERMAWLAYHSINDLDHEELMVRMMSATQRGKPEVTPGVEMCVRVMMDTAADADDFINELLASAMRDIESIIICYGGVRMLRAHIEKYNVEPDESDMHTALEYVDNGVILYLHSLGCPWPPSVINVTNSLICALKDEKMAELILKNTTIDPELIIANLAYATIEDVVLMCKIMGVHDMSVLGCVDIGGEGRLKTLKYLHEHGCKFSANVMWLTVNCAYKFKYLHRIGYSCADVMDAVDNCHNKSTKKYAAKHAACGSTCVYVRGGSN